MSKSDPSDLTDLRFTKLIPPSAFLRDQNEYLFLQGYSNVTRNTESAKSTADNLLEFDLAPSDRQVTDRCMYITLSTYTAIKCTDVVTGNSVNLVDSAGLGNIFEKGGVIAPRAGGFLNCVSLFDFRVGKETFSSRPSEYLHEYLSTLSVEDKIKYWRSEMVYPDQSQNYNDVLKAGDYNANPLSNFGLIQGIGGLEARGSLKPESTYYDVDKGVNYVVHTWHFKVITELNTLKEDAGMGLFYALQAKLTVHLQNLHQCLSIDAERLKNGEYKANLVSVSTSLSPQIQQLTKLEAPVLNFYQNTIQDTYEELPSLLKYNIKEAIPVLKNGSKTASKKTDSSKAVRIISDQNYFSSVPEYIIISYPRQRTSVTSAPLNKRCIYTDAFPRIDTFQYTFNGQPTIISTPQACYELSKSNGLSKSYTEWMYRTGGVMILSWKDLPQSSSMCVGIDNRYSFKCEADVLNLNTDEDIIFDCNIIPIYSGVAQIDQFGSVAKRYNIVKPEDIARANSMTKQQHYADWNEINNIYSLHGSSFASSIQNIYSKGKDLYNKGKDFYNKHEEGINKVVDIGKDVAKGAYKTAKALAPLLPLIGLSDNAENRKKVKALLDSGYSLQEAGNMLSGGGNMLSGNMLSGGKVASRKGMRARIK